MFSQKCRVSGWGASPRGRRSLSRGVHAGALGRRISAWAEEPCWGRGRLPGWPGASPRGRRGQRRRTAACPGRRRISAWAEEPGTRPAAPRAAGAHLRVGGGASFMGMKDAAVSGASPRGRRSPGAQPEAPSRHGRISAWAEEPRSCCSGAAPTTAHLRVGGGAQNLTTEVSGGSGASPRGRRSSDDGRPRVAWQRRISAWAEEPGTGFG